MQRNLKLSFLQGSFAHPNQAVNRTPKACRFWFPPLVLRRRLPQALKALASVLIGWVFGRSLSSRPHAKHPSVWQRFCRPTWRSGRGAIRRRLMGSASHSVFWFLALWVRLVHSIGSRHLVLGASSKTKGKQALNKSHQYAVCGRRTPFPWLLRRHSKGAAVLSVRQSGFNLEPKGK
ncbi:hypothetical protein F6453_3189 [Marinobacter nauticus]|uniref:Uncharacterized protein n=1 Tax=Marinobacter nauticus TaxID=2743 RepID=A0A833JQ45_MARNT|nr:hypothetical protein F6453_3189 [Marinobacter nauticus]